MKPGFFERLLAYFIDLIIVSLIVSLVSYSLPNKSNDINEKMSTITSEFRSGEIDSDTYLAEYNDLIYEREQSQKLENGIGLALTIAYFVIFQYMNKGQTLGKKLTHIRVVDKETKEPANMLKGFIR